MFFQPLISTLFHTGEEYELYSDWHKDAFGCRPGADQMARYHAMTPEERRIENTTIGCWIVEDARITAMSHEVARYRFSRRMEYLMRREGISEREAFMQTVVTFMAGDSPFYTFEECARDWDHVCYGLGLPYSDTEVLAAKWEELKGS